MSRLHRSHVSHQFAHYVQHSVPWMIKLLAAAAFALAAWAAFVDFAQV